MGLTTADSISTTYACTYYDCVATPAMIMCIGKLLNSARPLYYYDTQRENGKRRDMYISVHDCKR